MEKADRDAIEFVNVEMRRSKYNNPKGSGSNISVDKEVEIM
jgi:hypothetical protein